MRQTIHFYVVLSVFLFSSNVSASLVRGETAEERIAYVVTHYAQTPVEIDPSLLEGKKGVVDTDDATFHEVKGAWESLVDPFNAVKEALETLRALGGKTKMVGSLPQPLTPSEVDGIKWETIALKVNAFTRFEAMRTSLLADFPGFLQSRLATVAKQQERLQARYDTQAADLARLLEDNEHNPHAAAPDALQALPGEGEASNDALMARLAESAQLLDANEAAVKALQSRLAQARRWRPDPGATADGDGE